MDERSNRWTSGPAIVLYLAAFKLVLQLLVAQRYGYMQDELYFIACSDHLHWGYVDHPPLIVFITKAVRALTGDSLLSLRFLPAIAGAALAWMTGALTRTLGGGRFAQALAALGIIAVPMYLTFHYILSMNAFEPLFWTGLAYVVLVAVTRDRERLFLWVGVIVGLGMLNKYSMLVFATALLLGLLLTPYRNLHAGWLWKGTVVGFLIFLPHLLWAVHNHFPFIQWQHNIHANEWIHESAGAFLIHQVSLTGMASLLWMSGMVFFFFTAAGKPYRFLGWAFVITLGIFFAMHGRNYYPIPAYPMAIASGAVALEQETGKPSRVLIVAAILAGTVFLAPMYIPILPIDSLLRYQSATGMEVPHWSADTLSSPLSLYIVDQFGWQKLAATAANVYGKLPAEERHQAAIFTRTYAQASAIDFFGKQYGLPKAISGHLSYYLWGPGKDTSDVVIFVGYPFESVASVCENAKVGANMQDPYAYPRDMNQPIVVCRGFKINLQTQWSRLRMWY